MGESYHSDGRVTPDPAQRKQAAGFLALQRAAPPAQATANRYAQANSFHGVAYIAIRKRMGLIGSCSYQLLKRRKADRKRTTFGPGGTVSKSLPGSQRQGQDEDYVPVDDLDFAPARMLHEPNQNETMGELAAKLALQTSLTGVGPLWCVPNAAGKPTELWSLKTPFMYPFAGHGRGWPDADWRITPPAHGGSLPYGMSAGCVLPGSEVKRFIDPHPMVDWDGYSPFTAGAVELDVLRSIDKSRKSAMDNGLQLDAVLIAPGMDQGAMDKIAAAMEARHAGAENARKFAAIAPPPGMTDKATLQTFGASAKDMDYSQGWEQYVKFVLALFDVPPAAAGLVQASSYSELYAALRQYHYQQGMYIGRFEAWLTRVVARPWCSYTGEYLARVTLPPLDDPDATPEGVFKRQLDHDLLTYNQALAKDNNPPVPGGDVPVSVYLETLKAKLAPKPEPQPAPPGNPAPGKGGPLAGAVPTPDNPAAEGTGLPKVAKAMSELSGPDGGFLVPPGDAKTIAKRVLRLALGRRKRKGGESCQ